MEDHGHGRRASAGSTSPLTARMLRRLAGVMHAGDESQLSNRPAREIPGRDRGAVASWFVQSSGRLSAPPIRVVQCMSCGSGHENW
jgi:hypothetical protein